jgi:hypothetical protein
MPTYIRVTLSKSDNLTPWPFTVGPWNETLATQFFELQEIGMHTWVIDTVDSTLLIFYHGFTNNDDYIRFKDLIYSKMPLWTNDENRDAANEYCLNNNISIEIVEAEADLEDSNLATYTLITVP